MAWASWYYVSLIETIKTLPVRVKATSESEALDAFRDMMYEGAAPEEEERTVQYIVNKKVKSF